MPPIDKPNFTQIPNIILGDIERGNIVTPGLMAILEGSQLKVLLAVCRLTFGFHQNTRRASLTMIEKLTGLSRQGVVNAANKLEELGLINRTHDGGVTLWQIVVNSVDYLDSQDQSTELTGLVNSVDQGVNSVDSHLRNKPIKEIKKQTNGRPQAIPAMGIFFEITRYYKITKFWQSEVGRIVGNDPPNLEFWRHVVIGWTGKYSTVHNIEGMLDYYKRREIPGYNANGATNGHKSIKRSETLQTTEERERYRRMQAALTAAANESG